MKANIINIHEYTTYNIIFKCYYCNNINTKKAENSDGNIIVKCFSCKKNNELIWKYDK